jgi:flagellar biosynthetic protein FliQ
MDPTAMLIEALQLVLWLAAPALVACLLVAVLMNVLQTATQASDPSLGFVPKWFAVLLALFLSREFVAHEMLGFSSRMLQSMARLGH